MSIADLVVAILDKNLLVMQEAFVSVVLGRKWAACTLPENAQAALILELCFCLSTSEEAMPDDVCAKLDAPRASSYGEGARRVMARLQNRADSSS